jgi:hypothetical protein
MKSKSGIFLALAGRITQILAAIDWIAQRAELLMSKARSSGDVGYLDGVALILHSFYTAIESLFEDIARTVDGALPEGANWHQKLLVQMSAELNGSRPAVIRRSLRNCLDDYRAFRHLVRNVYSFNPMVAQNFAYRSPSFPRRRESTRFSEDWMPAYAGMTG